jgi:hypothetical protein
MSSVSYPKRPGYGRTGRPITVVTNHYLFRRLPDGVVHHYDVDIQPATPSPSNRPIPATVNNLIFDLFKLQLGDSIEGAGLVYDGARNAYAFKQFLPDGALRVEASFFSPVFP